MATSLVYKNNVDASKVVILSPYREQRSKISESLKKWYRCKDIPVTTIVKSQGKIHLFVVSLYFVITSTRNCNITLDWDWKIKVDSMSHTQCTLRYPIHIEYFLVSRFLLFLLILLLLLLLCLLIVFCCYFCSCCCCCCCCCFLCNHISF